MTSSAIKSSKTNSRRTLGAAIAAAVAASICCVGPLVLIALGASGAWMSSLTVLEPIKPLLTLATGGFLGYAVARVYAKSAEPEVCEPGSLCANPKTDRVNKLALWGVTALVAGLLMVPTFVASTNEAASVAPTSDAPKGTERVVLAIENMTCAACPHNVRKALAAVEGVTVLEVTMNPPRATVEYDSSKVELSELTKATNDIGYPSSLANS